MAATPEFRSNVSIRRGATWIRAGAGVAKRMKSTTFPFDWGATRVVSAARLRVCLLVGKAGKVVHEKADSLDNLGALQAEQMEHARAALA